MSLQHKNILINNIQETSPQENIRLGVISCCPRDSSFIAPPHDSRTWVISGGTPFPNTDIQPREWRNHVIRLTMAHYIPYRRESDMLQFHPIQHYQKGHVVCTIGPEPRGDYPVFARHFGSSKSLGECSMFEHPYFSPSYTQMPTQYSSVLPQWRNARVTKDSLSVWANSGIFHDRAFGEWHNVFGPRYFYGDNRRL